MKKIIAIAVASLGAAGAFAQAAGAALGDHPIYSWSDLYRADNMPQTGQDYNYGYYGWNRPYVQPDGRVIVPGRDGRANTRARNRNDRDGDGIPNHRDRHPDNPRRR